MSRTWVVITVLVGMMGMARADEVVLKSGRKVVGIAREVGDRIIVELDFGTVGFSKEDVISITPGRTVLHEYYDRAGRIVDHKDAAEFVALALWAGENGLARLRLLNLQRALALDPNHEGAHLALGHTLLEGKWLTSDEVRRQQGYVLFEGRWISPLEKELIISKRLHAEEEASERRARREAEQEARAEAAREGAERCIIVEPWLAPRRYYSPYRHITWYTNAYAPLDDFSPYRAFERRWTPFGLPTYP